MTKITESEIEAFTIEWFESFSYQRIYAPCVASDRADPGTWFYIV